MIYRWPFLVVLYVIPLVVGAVQAQEPSLTDACKNYGVALAAVQDPHVPYSISGGMTAHTADVAKGCAASPQTGDPAKVQEAANKVAVAAAPYQGAKP
jgi:hypothetical protein